MSEFRESAMKAAARRRALDELDVAIQRAFKAGAVTHVSAVNDFVEFPNEQGQLVSRLTGGQTITIVVRP